MQKLASILVRGYKLSKFTIRAWVHKLLKHVVELTSITLTNPRLTPKKSGSINKRRTSKHLFHMHLVVFKQKNYRDYLSEQFLHLDSESINKIYKQIQAPIGRLNAKFGNRLSQRAAWKLAKMCSHMVSANSEENHAIAQAWFFFIWTELCTLIPARHFARQFASISAGRTILIPIRSADIKTFSHWDDNELECIYIGIQLIAHGAKVIFVLENDSDEYFIADRLQIRLIADKKYFARVETFESHIDQPKTTVIVPAGIRNSQKIIGKYKNIVAIQTAYCYDPILFNAGIFKSGSEKPASIEIEFYPSTGFNDLPESKVFMAEKVDASLLNFIVFSMEDFTRKSLDKAHEIVRDFGIDRAFICDHSFFESSLIGYATKRIGGKVILWPHSSNSVHSHIYMKDDVHSIICITKSAQRAWLNCLPAIPSTVISGLMLKRLTDENELDPSKPLSVIILGGANSIRRIPLVDFRQHLASYRDIVDKLSRFGSDFRLLYKPKFGWEDAEWFRQNVSQDTKIEIVQENIATIDRPNMVLLTVSQGSTAILEGISRGIPSMVVRETEVEDYVSLSKKYFPIGGASDIAREIYKCRDLQFFVELRDRQRVWYQSETSFDAKF